MFGGQRDTYGDFTGIWYEFKDDPESLLKALQLRFVLDGKIFRKRHWTFMETVLVFYGICPLKLLKPHTANTGGLLLEGYIIPLMELIDEEHIHDLLWDDVPSEVCLDKDCVKVDKFLLFLQERKIKIPDYLLNHMRDIKIDITQGEDCNVIIQEEEEENYKKKRLRADSRRKLIAREIASGVWQREKKEIATGKREKYTSSSDLARSEDMQGAIQHLNNLFCIPPVDASECESDCIVDPEWFSDLFPGEKRGPKSKN